MALHIRNEEIKRLFGQGTTELTIEIPCDRCLEEVPTTFHIDINKEIPLEEPPDEEEEKLEAKTFYQNRFQQIITMVQQKEYDLLVLDEIMAAISAGFLEEKEVVHFLQNKPGTLEVVMTGRNPGEEGNHSGIR